MDSNNAKIGPSFCTECGGDYGHKDDCSRRVVDSNAKLYTVNIDCWHVHGKTHKCVRRIFELQCATITDAKKQGLELAENTADPAYEWTRFEFRSCGPFALPREVKP